MAASIGLDQCHSYWLVEAAAYELDEMGSNMRKIKKKQHCTYNKRNVRLVSSVVP